MRCGWCEERILAGDDTRDIPHYGKAIGLVPHEKGTHIERVTYHVSCFARMCLGGLNHQLGICRCCGGILDPDPMGMSRREAAQAAYDNYQRKKGSK